MLQKVKNYPDFLKKCWQEHLQKKLDNAPTVISTFAGAGGSSLGYSMAGFRELLAIEWDNNAVQTFKINFHDVPIYHGDIAKISVDKILEMTKLNIGELDILDGSPPCQGFSMAGKRQIDDPRNQLFREYVRLLRGLKPKVFVMENVSGMVKGVMKVLFAEILSELKASGYKVSAKILNAMYFNVPQSRERVIFIGVRNDLNVNPSHPKASSMPISISEAIKDLPLSDMCYLNPELTKLWEKCMPGKSFSSVHLQGHYFNTIKAHPLFPSPTITKTTMEASGSGIVHWEVPALLSIEMLKRVSSFPDDFIFVGNYREKWARIGNSVPPLFMRSIAIHIKNEILSRLIQSG